jgi:hypothetical protein
MVRPRRRILSDFEPEQLDLSVSTRPEVNERLHSRLRELFATKTASEWEGIGNATGALSVSSGLRPSGSPRSTPGRAGQ